MKYVILVPDGMAGLPLEELNDRTCMEAAHAPNMHKIARCGIVGTVRNVPRGMTPASDVANLSILGYNPEKYYCGRGPLEAANLGVDLEPYDVAFRFNTVTIADGKMVDYSAGHITTNETAVLTEELNKRLGSEKIKFYAGTSYRNLLVIRCENKEEALKLTELRCYPPHDILDKPISKYLPNDSRLVGLMERSEDILEGHDINKVRVDLGQNPANRIWIWGQGRKPEMPMFKEAYGITGGMISAVDLLKGLGRVLQLEVAEVPGATGYYDTDYEGKAEAAICLLTRHDMVFVHVEAPDEAGHNGDVKEKIRAIENFDSKITARLMKEIYQKGDCRILILPDHPTPVAKRTHTAEPVPFAMAGTGISADDVMVFTEKSAKAGSMAIDKGSDLMKLLLGGAK
ncbi:MAG: cofactor-independent phosphoglycerate mutase [Candidatus Omnitrophota bacterium]